MHQTSIALIKSEVLRIAEDIMNKAHHDVNGVFFTTKSINRTKTVVEIDWRISENLYNGVSGILLFYLDLYRTTGDKEFFAFVSQGTNWLIHHISTTPPSSYSFYTGRTGTLYFLSEYYKTSRSKSVLNVIESSLSQYPHDINRFFSVNDLLNGSAGAVVGMLHIHQATRHPKCLHIINSLTRKVVSEIYYDKNGIYWDHRKELIKGLCGFSHGNSGMSFMFLELYKYFNNPTFHWLADLAIEYENRNFVQSINNWPDLRGERFFLRGNTTPAEKFANISKYLKNASNLDFSAWCHGAPGIGLSRLRAFELAPTRSVRSDIEKAADKTRESLVGPKKMTSATLCHGLFGNAYFLLEKFRIDRNPNDHNFCETLALEVLKEKDEIGYYKCGYAVNDSTEDLSLFMGTAGIGYFLNRLLHPSGSSILRPDVLQPCQDECSKFNFINCTKDQVKNIFLQKTHPLLFLEMQRAKDIEVSSVVTDDFKVDYINNRLFLRQKTSTLRFEAKQFRLSTHIQNFASIYAHEEKVTAENATLTKLPFSDLSQMPLRLSKYVKLDVVQTFGHHDSDTLQLQYYLKRILSTGLTTTEITPFSYSCLRIFRRPRTIPEAFLVLQDTLVHSFNLETLQASFKLAVTNALGAAILVKA